MKLFKRILCMVGILLSLGCTIPTQEIDYTEYEALLESPPTKPIETRCLELINEYRSGLDLPPFLPLPIIKSVAHNHTQAMITTQLLSHDGWGQRSQYLQFKTGAISVSENVAYGYQTADQMVAAWIASEGHHKNIISTKTHADICIEQDQMMRLWATNLFITCLP